mmetsp:Transcript_90516/g.242764  ORF Transcript_90516/g.242764 Transcript_90516/m.242764 type:complete len:84 (-) Transcript_90516:2067-2318(-)
MQTGRCENRPSWGSGNPSSARAFSAERAWTEGGEGDEEEQEKQDACLLAAPCAQRGTVAAKAATAMPQLLSRAGPEVRRDKSA